MNNKFKYIAIKNCTYYFDDMLNIKDCDPNKIKIDENSNQNILIQYIGYMTFKDIRYIKIDSVNPLYLIMNGYFEEINLSKYLTRVPSNESKDRLKK